MILGASLSPAQRKRLERKRRKQGIPPDPERSARNSARAIPVVDKLDGTKYPSIAAASFATGMSESSISYALKHPASANAARWAPSK